jgi:hypothetical protein
MHDPSVKREELAPAEMYHRVFVGHAEGAKVLEDLVARFHDRAIHVPGGIEGQRETEKRAAQKEVIGFVLRRIGSIHYKEENEND